MSLKQSFAIMLWMIATASAQTYTNIPAGTQLQVRIIEKLSSEQASVGDQFHGTFAAPVVVNGRTLFSKGTDVTGEVTNVERSGRLSRPGELHLSLRTVRSGGRTYAIAADPFVIKGESHTIGAAAGTGVAAGTGKKPAEVESEAVLTWVAANPPSGSVMQGQERRQASRYDEDDDDRPSRSGNRTRSNNQDEDNDDQGPREFSSRERQIISDCYAADRSNLPPGLAKKDRLPPGLERQLRRNGTLPPGLQKRVQPLPGVCTARLPRLPRDWARVVLSGRIILLDPSNRIVDFFWMDADE